jgi:hypothetical protein
MHIADAVAPPTVRSKWSPALPEVISEEWAAGLIVLQSGLSERRARPTAAERLPGLIRLRVNATVRGGGRRLERHSLKTDHFG